MGKILITDQLDPLALQLISEAGHEFDLAPGPWTASALAARAQGYSAIMGTLSDELGAEVFASPELQVLATVSVGVNHIDLKAAEAAGVSIINTPDVLTDATAELTLAMMLMVLRKTARAEADLRAGNWNGWALNDHLGSQFSTRTLGIVGYGRIGQAVAKRAEAFGVTCLHHQRTATGLPGYCASLDELCEAVDLLSLHLPLSPQTQGIIGSRQLDLLGPEAVLINSARGGLVHEEELAKALEDGRLAGAALDCYVAEPAILPALLNAPNIVLLPHIASATHETRREMAILAVTGVLEVLAGRRPSNLFPSS